MTASSISAIMSDYSTNVASSPTTFVRKYTYTLNGIDQIGELSSGTGDTAWNVERYLGRYPTVYVVTAAVDSGHVAYVGETNNIHSRTRQHFHVDAGSSDDWAELRDGDDPEIYVIGSDRFNKSLTLDLENKLMQYMTSSPSVRTVNARSNPQNDYYSRDHLESIFATIWSKLHADNPGVFPAHEAIRSSAIFKASPFHKLTAEQFAAKEHILAELARLLATDTSGHLILVEGAAGTGKTVLLSSLFFNLFNMVDETEHPLQLKTLLTVNHDEQLVVYKDLARRLDLRRFDFLARPMPSVGSVPVMKPTQLINNYSEGEDIDVILVDEAHLLYTQGKQSYRGKNQLEDLIARARIVIAIYDPQQPLATNQYWEEDPVSLLGMEARSSKIVLESQVRIRADETTQEWIRNLVDAGEVGELHHDEQGYDLQIFESAVEMRAAIRLKAKDPESRLSRIVATYDWPYNKARKPENGGYWTVELEDGFSMPWNLQLPREMKSGLESKLLAWAERPESIDEVGSTFTLQGFDLNFAGVILGRSVVFRDGRIEFDSRGSYSRGATMRRTFGNQEKRHVAEELLRNELNVLLTRGVNGLYIYAQDEALREELLRVSKSR